MDYTRSEINWSEKTKNITRRAPFCCFVQLAFMATIFSVSCSPSHNYNGEISYLSDKAETTELCGTKIHIDDYSPLVNVIDSVAIFYQFKSKENFFKIVNVESGHVIGSYCPKGHGHNEFVSLSGIEQIYNDNGEFKTILLAPNESKIIIWNITKTITENTTIYDSIYNYASESKSSVSYNNPHIIGRDSLLFLLPSIRLSENDRLTDRYYQMRTLSSDELIKEIKIFDQPLDNVHSNVLPEVFFNAAISLKPDKSHFVEAMYWLPQINIVNIKTGDIKGYRFSMNIDETIFMSNMEHALCCYKSVASNDNYIFALWSGEEMSVINSEKGYQRIDVFDWHGVLNKQYLLRNPINALKFDTSTGFLYGWNIAEQQLYKYYLFDI